MSPFTQGLLSCPPNKDGGGNEKSWQSLETAAPSLSAEKKVDPHLLRDTPMG